MFDSKDMEIQADMPEDVICESSAQKSFIKTRVFRLKNPLETLLQYKKRIFGLCKDREVFKVSSMAVKQECEFKVLGSRCGSVNITGKKCIGKGRSGMSFTSVRPRPRKLPKLFFIRDLMRK